MKRVALVGVVAGCNQIYGLDPTRVEQPDAQQRTTKLSYLVASSRADASPGELTTAPITPDPRPRVAALDGSFADAPYTDGSIVYPAALAAGTWRLEYTPAGEVTHELQWAPGETTGNVVVPLFGPTTRARTQPGTGYRLVLDTGTPYTWQSPVVYTTGYWTAAYLPSGSSLHLDFNAVAPSSGDWGAPDATTHTRVIALDYTSSSNCRVVSRAAVAPAPELAAGTFKDVALVNDGSSGAITFAFATSHADALRLALGDDEPGSRHSETGQSARAIYGRVAHPDAPLFTESVADIPAPLMITLADCPIIAGTGQTPTVFDLGGASSQITFPESVFAFAANDRLVSGARLRSSIAGVATAPDAPVGSSNYVVDAPVHIATQPRLGTFDLDTGPDGQSIGDTPQTLTFALDDRANVDTDYFEVALYRLAAPELELVRVYVGAVPSQREIRFDPTIMSPGEEYVFAIRTIRGRPGARTFDFAPVRAPQAVATIFTRTFKR